MLPALASSLSVTIAVMTPVISWNVELVSIPRDDRNRYVKIDPSRKAENRLIPWLIRERLRARDHLNDSVLRFAGKARNPELGRQVGELRPIQSRQ